MRSLPTRRVSERCIGRKEVEDGASRQSSRTRGGPLRALCLWLSRRRFGEVAEPLTVMAHHPKLLLGYGMMELAFERSKLVDEHLKSLAVLKAATMVGCEFCIDIGSVLSRAEGVTEEQLRELPAFEQSEAFSPLALEKLVLRYAAAARKTSAPGVRA